MLKIPKSQTIMSRFPGQSGRPLFASATTYDALEVEEGEESEEEEQPADVQGIVPDRYVGTWLPVRPSNDSVAVLLRMHQSQPSLLLKKLNALRALNNESRIDRRKNRYLSSPKLLLTERIQIALKM